MTSEHQLRRLARDVLTAESLDDLDLGLPPDGRPGDLAPRGGR